MLIFSVFVIYLHENLITAQQADLTTAHQLNLIIAQQGNLITAPNRDSK
jgi:predicted nucleotide-binding protein